MIEKTIGIFGSAFNPPTKGHANAFMQFINDLDEIWLVPSFSHAFGKKPLSFDVRCEMLSLFIKNLDRNKIKISKIEEDVFNKMNTKYVYTYDLLVYLKEIYPNYKFKFICGEDNADPETWKKFKDSDKIDQYFGKLVAKELLDVRSTYVRNYCADKDYEKLEGLLFENNINYIKENKLFI